MVKILAKSGDSLADIYDVEGSIAGIETLESRELPIVHEMGGTVFSERLGATIERLTTGAIAQNIAWNLTLGTARGVSRVLGIYVQADAARVDQCAVSIRATITQREIPIFIWDTNNDRTSNIRIVEEGGPVGTDTALIQATPGGIMPSMIFSAGQGRNQVGDEIVFRGLASAFGAGTVVVTALIFLARATDPTAGLNSRGLPIPGW